ncbi:MAG: Rad52/Rad22 family DNA repair protein [Anderseniella sp.]|jgi:hypothetical protein|nr:Rad52/Rad22 family DNA repair protein [Anderseniella sp.]
MPFQDTQLRQLRRRPASSRIRERVSDGVVLHYLEGHHVIDQANRIFGFDGWDRETVYCNCVASRHVQGRVQVSYVTRVRITVRAGATLVCREGLGAGEATADTAGQAHDRAAKAAETDATKRALSTFGAPFGLTLYAAGGRERRRSSTAEPDRAGQPESANATASDRADVRHPVDKSQLQVSEPKRQRNRDHLKFVATLGCLVCGRRPAHAHHLTFIQPRALQRKASDEYAVPLCAIHHDELHRKGNERDWWRDRGLDPAPVAADLWAVTLGHKTPASVSLDRYLDRARRTLHERDRTA